MARIERDRVTGEPRLPSTGAPASSSDPEVPDGSGEGREQPKGTD